MPFYGIALPVIIYSLKFKMIDFLSCSEEECLRTCFHQGLPDLDTDHSRSPEAVCVVGRALNRWIERQNWVKFWESDFVYSADGTTRNCPWIWCGLGQVHLETEEQKNGRKVPKEEEEEEEEMKEWPIRLSHAINCGGGFGRLDDWAPESKCEATSQEPIRIGLQFLAPLETFCFGLHGKTMEGKDGQDFCSIEIETASIAGHGRDK